MTKKDTKLAIEIMQAYVEGKQIQFKYKENEVWSDIGSPRWSFDVFDYRVKPEPKYRPYANAEEFLKAQQEHGMYIKVNGIYVLPIRIAFDKVEGKGDISYGYLLKNYQWQDGTPCGIMEE